MWFGDWAGLFRVLAVGAAAYLFLVVLLRVSGKRTLSKLNAFDLVVTVAMGSTLASALTSKDLPFAEAAAAFLVLVVAQYVVAKLSVHSRGFAQLVRAEPRLLFARGRFLEDALRAERVTRDEVLSAMRGSGFDRPEDVGAVLLEGDGSMHVLARCPPVLDASELDGRPAGDER